MKEKKENNDILENEMILSSKIIEILKEDEDLTIIY